MTLKRRTSRSSLLTILIVVTLNHCHFNTVGPKDIKPTVDTNHKYHIIYADNVQYQTISYWDLFTFTIQAGESFTEVVQEVFPLHYPLAEFVTSSALLKKRPESGAKILRVDYEAQFIMGRFADKVVTTVSISQLLLNSNLDGSDRYLIQRTDSCTYEYSAFSPYKDKMFRISIYGALKKYFERACEQG